MGFKRFQVSTDGATGHWPDHRDDIGSRMSQLNLEINPPAAPLRVVPRGRKKGRTYFLTNPKFQFSFLTYFVILSVLSILTFYWANSYFFARFIRQGHEMGLPTDHVFFKFIAEQQHAMDVIFSLTAVIVVTLLLAGGLILSHRVAGPLYRFSEHLKRFSGGDPIAEIKFRKGDYFHELALDFNLLVRRLKENSDQHK